MLAGVNGWHHDSKAAWQPRHGYVEESVQVNARAKGNLIDGRDLHAEFRAFVDLVIKKDAQATTKIAVAEKLAFLSTPVVSDEQAQATLKGTIVAKPRDPTLAEQIVGLHEPDDKADEKDAKGGTYVTTRTPPRDEGEEKRARDRALRAEKAKEKAAKDAKDAKGDHG
jgi:hypothetical protein